MYMSNYFARSDIEFQDDDVEILKRFAITELPDHQDLYAYFPKKAFQWFMSIFELCNTHGTSRVSKEGSLNERSPNIKPLTVRELLYRY